MKVRSIFILSWLAALALVFGPVSTAVSEEKSADDEFEEDEPAGDEASEDSESEEESEDESEDDSEPAESKDTGEGLMLSKGTMQAGGTIILDLTRAIPDQGDSVGGGSFTFAPQAGYFIIDKLELLADFGFSVPFGDLYEDASKSVFFDVGARYFFDFNVICVYAGALFGMNFEIGVPWVNADGDNIEQNWPSVVLSIPAGILFPFNSYVALDAGMRFNVDIGVGDNPLTYIDVPIGYFGVQGFFKLF